MKVPQVQVLVTAATNHQKDTTNEVATLCSRVHVTNGKLGCPSQRRSHDGHFLCWHLPGSPSNKRRILCACCIRTLNTLFFLTLTPTLLRKVPLIVSLTCSRPALQGRGLQVQGRNGPGLSVPVVGISPTLMPMTLLPLAWQAPYSFPPSGTTDETGNYQKGTRAYFGAPGLPRSLNSRLLSALHCFALHLASFFFFLTRHCNCPTAICQITVGVPHTLPTPRSLRRLGQGPTRFRIIRNKHRNLQ
ncbi:hypothetical protein BDP55DRAFT_343919 [Colletotrichum godetiae]|uniref:Uncharacterized protein n=1 Tax=Colletotrichum godetiae TaxID=1209918 RepID=A0AAJ0F045_9PEZI|nr:uncharacterized protein BDP55DRAFT_343919 [Colletotrichum godetiae]KAK1690266.1 hypothetical protein BDP55DRAFT_343919 [Colletotrichum godetiae]